MFVNYGIPQPERLIMSSNNELDKINDHFPEVGNMVHIHWEDSGSVDGLIWQFKDSWECSVHDCNTVGYLVSKDKLQVVVAQSSNDDQWGRLFAIPLSSIVNVEEIK